MKMGIAHNLGAKQSQPLGWTQGQVLNKEAGRPVALLVKETKEPLELSWPKNLVYLQHSPCLM